ncbi:MAG: 2-oxoisovalerate dehydrogenase E2 component (dihydrolipoyl transacylase) [Chloroflexi bacterium]|jgi:2-oxoisovalerate dehydrogenase E2 component (dihydrolipoyl transacylase)|nr:MAG: 2-oxoisovalerate dehydrogenase E2 component (dihydrolipoyl transacylase) [Chloroflexota bacterium]
MKIELPQVGESVTEGIIGRWLKNVGDKIEKYDPLVEVITDKINMELPSPVRGVLREIIANEGETVQMGGFIADIETNENQENTNQDKLEPDVTDQEIGTTGVLLKNTAPVGPTGSSGPISRDEPLSTHDESPPKKSRYSPAVLRLAEENQIDLAQIVGTGINERITRKDVISFIEANSTIGGKASTGPSDQDTQSRKDQEKIALTPVRKMIAANMSKSAALIPQAWSEVAVDVTGMVSKRQDIKESFMNKEGINITYLPFVIKAVAESLKKNPLLNATWSEEGIILKKNINIGIAVAAPDGLVVPVIHNADFFSIAGLAEIMEALISKAKNGKLTLPEVQGGTFTLNNTGALGSVSSRPLVNHPQAAIMTTEAIIKRPVIKEDAIAIRSMMNICLSFDHRIMDGAEAGTFSMSVKQLLENIGSDTLIY